MTDDTTSLMGALKHPLRRQILKSIYQRGEAVSPRQIAEQLDEQLSNTSYHVRVLVIADLICLTHTETVRGTLAHYYACVPRVASDPLIRQALELDGDDAPSS